MDINKFLHILNVLGLNQTEAARKLGVNPRTVRKYVSGKCPVPIPGPVEAALTCWYDAHRRRRAPIADQGHLDVVEKHWGSLKDILGDLTPAAASGAVGLYQLAKMGVRN